MEVYTKVKGEESGYRREKLEDFTDISLIPEFDYSIKWRKLQEKTPRKTTYQREDYRQRPSMVGQNTRDDRPAGISTVSNSLRKTSEEPAAAKPLLPDSWKKPSILPLANQGKVNHDLVRANSNTTHSISKKVKLNTDTAPEDEEDEDMSSGSGSEDDASTFSTPMGEK